MPGDLKVAAFRMVEKLLADGIRGMPAGALTVYLQGVGNKVMLAVKVQVAPGCELGDPATPENLEIADFRTRVETFVGQFSLSHRRDGIRIWSSWPHPAHAAPPPTPRKTRC